MTVRKKSKQKHLAPHHQRYAWYTIVILSSATFAMFVGAIFALSPRMPKPTLDRVAPFLLEQSDLQHGSVRLRLFGTGFRPGITVAVSQYPALRTVLLSDTELSVDVAADTLTSGWYDILARNTNRQTAVLHSAFGVRDADGTVPERFFAIRQENGAVTFASSGDANKSSNGTLSVGYDNYPNISVGSYTVTGTDMTAYAQTFADRYDYLFGTFPMSAVNAINAHVQNFPYSDMTEFNNGIPDTGRDGHTDDKITSYVTTYNASHDPDISAEDFYLHAKCDCDMLYGTAGHCATYSAANPQCTQTAGCPYSFITGTKTQYKGWNSSSPGTANTGCNASTATTRAESRMMSAYLPQWDVPNYANTQLDDFYADTFQNENITWAGGASAVAGVDFDTVVKDNPSSLADGLQMSWEYWGADVRSTTTPAQPFYDYFSLQQSVRTKLSSNPGQSGFRYTGNVITIPNEYPSTIYTADTLSNVQDNFVEIFFDHYKNSSNTYQAECGQWKSLLDETTNSSERFFLNSYERTGTYCSAGSSYDCRTDRGKIESLASYYLVQNDLTTYLYAADVAPFTPDAFWNPAVTVDIGQPAATPSGAKDIFGNTGTTNFYNFVDPSGGFSCPIVSTAPSNAVYARNYTNGLVLVKHRYDYNDTTVYGDESGSDTTKQDYALGDSYHSVNADGTLSAMTTSVNLSNSEGAVLLKDRPPVVAAMTDKVVAENQTLSFTVTASDPDNDAITLDATGMPTGATLVSSGPTSATFSFTPGYTQAGTYTVSFSASDGVQTGSTSIALTVTNTDRAPALGGVTDQHIEKRQLLALSITGSDPDGDIPALTATNLPSGATFTDAGDGTATLRWQPSLTQAGDYPVVLTANDGTLTTTGTLTISVSHSVYAITDTSANDPPVFDALTPQTIVAGQVLALAVVAVDPEGSTPTLSASQLPDGATFTDHHDSTGTFRWQPYGGQEGTYAGIRFSANDGTTTSTASLTVTVLPAGAGGAFPQTKNFTPFRVKSISNGSVAVGDVWGDAREDIIVGAGSGMLPEVRVYTNDGRLRTKFYAYPKSFHGGVRIAACDLNGDGRKEIITAPGVGYAPRVRIFDAYGKQIGKKEFWVLDGRATNGVWLGCGDVNGDGKQEVIAASDTGGGRITVHTKTGSRLASFYPYGTAYAGGLSVTTLRPTGKKTDEIVTAPLSGNASIATWSGTGKLVYKKFLAFAASYKGGATVAKGDVDGDGKDELIVAPLSGSGETIRMFGVHSTTVRYHFLPYSKSYKAGIRLASGDVDGDGSDDIITLPATAYSPQIKVFDQKGRLP